MRLLYISTFMFREINGTVYGLPSCVDVFFRKYLDVFENVTVLGEKVKDYLDVNSLVQIKDTRINVKILKANTVPRDFVNDKEIKRYLYKEIQNAQAIIIKPASRKGMMAIDIVKKLNKPYMIEMTGDLHNALKQHPNILKRMYAPFLYMNIKKHIIDCKYGLYVSQEYLQNQFPIKGKMCGCSDVVLKECSDEILKNRLLRISNIKEKEQIDLALIGFYQGKMKGVDTAIRALGKLPAKYHLSILGNGTEENRIKWIEYGRKYGVYDRLHFPNPLSSSEEVLLWLDNIDFFVLPTRSEGLCRCIVEAISRGCPCFATNICSMPELLQQECLFELGDDKKLAELILYYSNNIEELKAVAIRNYNKSKEYGFEILRKRRNDFLNEFKKYCEEKDAT